MLRQTPKTETQKAKDGKVIAKAEKAAQKAQPKIVFKGGNNRAKAHLRSAESQKEQKGPTQKQRNEYKKMMEDLEKEREMREGTKMMEDLEVVPIELVRPINRANFGMVKDFLIGILSLPAGPTDQIEFSTRIKNNDTMNGYLENKLSLISSGFGYINEHIMFAGNYAMEFARIKRMVPMPKNDSPIKHEDKQCSIPTTGSTMRSVFPGFTPAPPLLDTSGGTNAIPVATNTTSVGTTSTTRPFSGASCETVMPNANN
jgi:hypothetical protein